MSCCDSRDQDSGVCVCSVQLWIISTLFLLWPTCSERRIWEYAHMSAEFSSYLILTVRLPEGSPYGEPYADFKLSISGGDNLEPRKHPGCTWLQNWTADTRRQSWIPPPVLLRTCRLLKVYKLFFFFFFYHPSSYLHDVEFLWSPWKTPISIFFLLFEINSGSFAPTQCGLPWIPLSNGLTCTWICL